MILNGVTSALDSWTEKKQMRMKILFKKTGKLYTLNYIKKCVRNFGSGYNNTVLRVTEKSENGMDRAVFFDSVAMLMPNFLMTRAGPFKGVEYFARDVRDPNGQIASCWDTVGNGVVGLRDYLDRKRKGSRVRVLVDMRDAARQEMTSELWKIFTKLEPICRGETTLGLVAASKVLFAVLPEVALPIDNAEWRKAFKTINYGDIVMAMAEEIHSWENKTQTKLHSCDPDGGLTLPAIYNVMAMKARP